MKQYTQNQLQKSKSFVRKYARMLDFEIMNFALDNTDKSRVLDELQKYQNPDGGFGNGLEPDLRTPLSSNIATTYAFQYFHKLNLSKLPDFLRRSLGYFGKNYSKKYQRWIPILRESESSPHAIWWNYDEAKYTNESQWGNPTVEIIGYLLKYNNGFDKNELKLLKQKALKRLLNADEIEIHELMCYLRFVKSLDSNERNLVYDKIKILASRQLEKDTTKWSGYVPRPLNYVDSLHSPVYQILKKYVDIELDYLIDTVDKDGGWYPNWEWGQFEEEWSRVKPEIAGMITVNNLISLKIFKWIQ